MTNWRERGYVPASDGEDSDAELSTQEESLGSPIPRREETPDKLGRNEEMGNGGDGGDKMEQKISGDTEGPGMELLNATDGEFMDIDKALGVATQPQKSVRERLSIEHMTAVLPADIPVVDLSNQRDEADDEDGGVGLQVHNRLQGLLNATNCTVGYRAAGGEPRAEFQVYFRLSGPTYGRTATTDALYSSKS